MKNGWHPQRNTLEQTARETVKNCGQEEQVCQRKEMENVKHQYFGQNIMKDLKNEAQNIEGNSVEVGQHDRTNGSVNDKELQKI